MTDPGVAARRTPPAPRRRHPALGARIAATGISTAAMLGIVASFGIADRPADATDEPASVAAVIVDPQTTRQSAVTIDEPTDEAVALTANPVLRAEPAPRRSEPIARTNGSR